MGQRHRAGGCVSSGATPTETRFASPQWPVLPAGVPPPDWCGDFLVWLGGKRIAPDGQIETLSGDELLKLGAQLRPHMNEETELRPAAALEAFAAARAARRPLRQNHAGAGG
jgi:hypothetical protein